MRLLGGILLAVLTLASAKGRAQAPATPPPADDGKKMLLWPSGAPGQAGDADIDKPTLTAYLPASNPTKTAVIVAPGGGYVHLSMIKEGSDIAHWLNARGVAAFVLTYRLGPKYHNPIELKDAQRAIRTVRAGAAGYGVATDHIGISPRRLGQTSTKATPPPPIRSIAPAAGPTS
jgi:acetyl esterase/lipase